ncbi:tetratricopeptide repeat protein [Plebeiibacterium marinum]|uniref:Tetratricopeptide repeat protein n=1 Tax=Plebeiibacterium marinum TaxID=2992111 RepID=A0AAE3SKB4_9BACT|nr:tetratricopeptide repeat protein [Plebeiobacterium marinum]MCW3805300.1 tetratricopeptide repeat protein [Plebeiobacterium marinum]
MKVLLPNHYAKIIGVCICFFIPTLLFSQPEKKHSTLDVDKIFSLLEFKGFYYPNEAKKELDSVVISMSETDAFRYNSYIDYTKALLLFNDLKMDSALILIERAVSGFSVNENLKWQAKCQILLGQIAEVTGLYEQAKINFYKAIEIGEQKTTDAGFAYVGIARCKIALEEDFNLELNLGVDILKTSVHQEERLFGEFMELLYSLSDKDVPDKLNLVAEKYLNLGMTHRAASVYKVIASSYNARNMFEEAHKFCDKAIKLCEDGNNSNLILPALYQFKGVLFFNQEQYNVAEIYFVRSLELYRQNNQPKRMLYAYDYLHKIDIAKRNFAKAYVDLKEYQELQEELMVFEKIRMAKVLEINNKIDQIKSQMKQLEVEKKASEFMLYLVIVITITILFAVGVYVYLYMKNKKTRIEELNKEFQNLLIGIGEKQLLEHRLSQEGNRNNAPKEHPINYSQSGAEIVDSFDNCYLETISLFTHSFPSLTKTEVRYAVMLCLKLPMEIIAKVQNVQPASIRKAKQRIRTKLNVDGNIEDYLQNFREKLITDMTKK